MSHLMCDDENGSKVEPLVDSAAALLCAHPLDSRVSSNRSCTPPIKIISTKFLIDGEKNDNLNLGNLPISAFIFTVLFNLQEYFRSSGF